jgi:hypothetical protein
MSLPLLFSCGTISMHGIEPWILVLILCTERRVKENLHLKKHAYGKTTFECKYERISTQKGDSNA